MLRRKGGGVLGYLVCVCSLCLAWQQSKKRSRCLPLLVRWSAQQKQNGRQSSLPLPLPCPAPPLALPCRPPSLPPLLCPGPLRSSPAGRPLPPRSPLAGRAPRRQRPATSAQARDPGKYRGKSLEQQPRRQGTERTCPGWRAAVLCSWPPFATPRGPATALRGSGLQLTGSLESKHFTQTARAAVLP